MKIDILLQGEAIADIELVTLSEGARFSDVLKEAAKRRRHDNDDGDYLVFREDDEEPVDPKTKIGPHEPGKPHRVQVHRCRRIEVHTSFNGKVKTASFSPAQTVGAAKRRIAEKLFGLDPKDAAEHVLQLSGTNERPEPDTHLGSLVGKRRCALDFDLVPLARVEG